MMDLYINEKEKLLYADAEYMDIDKLARVVKSPDYFRHLFRYKNVYLRCNQLKMLPSTFLLLCTIRLMCRDKMYWVDRDNMNHRVSIGRIMNEGKMFVYEHLTYKKQVEKIDNIVTKLMSVSETKGGRCDVGSPLYIRPDLGVGIVAGGSIGHVAGVLNQFSKILESPIYVSIEKTPMLSKNIRCEIIDQDIPFSNVSGSTQLFFNILSYKAMQRIARTEKVAFLYERNALYHLAGVRIALEFKIPYVLEYNGSEVWIHKHWSRGNLRFPELAQRIERLSFQKATLITCVSAPLKNQLAAAGVDENKILVNPNGVDVERYHPDIDGRPIRLKYQIPESAVVVGFIGTFGLWHGTEVLAKAFCECIKEDDQLHLLMIGDGIRMNVVKKTLTDIDSTKYTFTGIVPQEEGAGYLAACDILVNPTAENPDGTPFFGSPTKLYEYMAMGKAIISSDLDQMSETLQDGETALLVPPGDVGALKNAIMKLVYDRDLRNRLGKSAREEACCKHTWRQHTQRIVDKLREIMSDRSVG